jgi:phytoene/squalene synthetase
VTAEDLAQGHYTPGFVQLMTFEAGRACSTTSAWAALPAADARRLFAAEIMGRTYFALLQAIEARRFDVFARRVTLSTPRRLAIALRGWLGARLSAS